MIIYIYTHCIHGYLWAFNDGYVLECDMCHGQNIGYFPILRGWSYDVVPPLGIPIMRWMTILIYHVLTMAHMGYGTYYGYTVISCISPTIPSGK